MKKWLIISGLILVVLAGCIPVTPTQIHLQTLKKDLVILRVMAEHRELEWKIQEYEKKLAGKTAKKQPKIWPVPRSSNVEIK